MKVIEIYSSDNCCRCKPNHCKLFFVSGSKHFKRTSDLMEGHSFVFKPCHIVFPFDSTSNFVSAPLSLWGHHKRPCGLRLLLLYSDLRGFPVSFASLLCSESFFSRYSAFLRSPKAPFA